MVVDSRKPEWKDREDLRAARQLMPIALYGEPRQPGLSSKRWMSQRAIPLCRTSRVWGLTRLAARRVFSQERGQRLLHGRLS